MFELSSTETVLSNRVVGSFKPTQLPTGGDRRYLEVSITAVVCLYAPCAYFDSSSCSTKCLAVVRLWPSKGGAMVQDIKYDGAQ